MVATRSLTDSTNQNTSSIKATLERLSNAMDQMNQQIDGLLLFQQISQPVIDHMNNGEGTSNRGGQSSYGRLTKLKFPKFNSEDVQGWLYRVNMFFTMDRIQEDAQKLMLVSMHLFDYALNWHKQFLKSNRNNVTWIQYEAAIKERFDPINEDLMVDQPEAYAISLFIRGLKDEIGLVMRMFRPTNHTDVYSLAKMQEAILAIPKSRYTTLLNDNKVASTPFMSKSGGYAAKSNTLALPAPPQSGVPNRPRKQLTQQEMAKKRAKHLCFYCDQRYSPGHKCSGQMYYLEVASCEEEIKDEEYVGSELDQVVVREEEVMPQVSLNALNGVNSYQTMRIKGHVGKQVVHMLVDCISTHNFLDLQAAKRMRCRMSKMCPLQVSVANGQVMSSVYMCKNFKWNLQGHEFVTDVMILPLGGCEMVLGIQWLATLEKIQCDFKNLVMEFVINGQKCVLRGTTQSVLKWMQGRHVSSSLSQMGIKISSMAMCIYPATLMQLSSEITQSKPKIQTLLKEFTTVFDDPKELPPKRSHDHTIPLTPNAPPLLDAGTIRNSQSPFSSPIVMVKKKDGTWRICVDYRQLNKHTIKDKYPIPVIEELLDELSGAKVFLKLDLRSAYHQIRMNEVDIHKTAFRTHKGHYEFLVMPFGLTNAPSTFQALMNTMFKLYLRKFFLVFFDDILIYNAYEEEHWKHLQKVLQTMKENTLFAKLSKCSFPKQRVEYLGHIISKERVSTDPSKIQAMKQWPIPQTIKQLRGFLGLTRYYRKFIKNFAWISKPLTNLLKKDAFMWSKEAQTAFNQLKEAMTQTPVLALPDYNKTFVVETDASGVGIRAMLQQEGHPIAYLSKTLAPKHQALSTYKKEFQAVLMALEKWRSYLLDRHFKIKTDHFSLKYLLNQRVTTLFQAKWLPKLLVFDYEISYNKGSDNVVTDALSRITNGSELNSLILSTITSELHQKVQGSYANDLVLQKVTQKIANGTQTSNKYVWEGNVLKRKGKIVVGPDEQLKTTIVQHYHADAIRSHSVKKVIRECDMCQREKVDLVAYPRLLQPLSIPEKFWSEISMDFIVGLLKSQGKTVIFVMVDRLSKYAHFMALSHPYTTSSVAQVFLDTVYMLYGLPNSIVSDRESVFLSLFWQSLFKLLKVELKMSTAYHPQTDGQTEVVNKCLECYLRCMTGERPKEWVQWLPLAEYWYNTNKHSCINVTPYEVVYGQTPPLHNPYVSGESAVETVDRSLQAREAAIEMIKFHITRAQDRMKKYAYLKRSEREFDVGMWVYLKLQPHRQLTIRKSMQNKLSAKYYGPFFIVAKVGVVAYKLDLPEDSQIHPVFHVSQLKLCKGTNLKMGILPDCGEDGILAVEPEAILDRRMAKLKNRAAVYVLVK
ncbi:retrotransposon-related protein [Tanacetum coccineum]